MILSLTVGLGYLYFFEAGAMLFSGTRAFAQEWQFFSSVPATIQNVIGSEFGAKLICGLIFFFSIGLWTYQAKTKEDRQLRD
jgi:hypothetical protein